MGETGEVYSDRFGLKGAVSQIFAHIGTVRSEILVYSVLASTLLFGFSTNSNGSALEDFTNIAMRLAGIAILFLALGFYIYAYRKLPSSTQARIFTEQSIKEISITRKAIRRAKENTK